MNQILIRNAVQRRLLKRQGIIAAAGRSTSSATSSILGRIDCSNEASLGVQRLPSGRQASPCSAFPCETSPQSINHILQRRNINDFQYRPAVSSPSAILGGPFNGWNSRYSNTSGSVSAIPNQQISFFSSSSSSSSDGKGKDEDQAATKPKVEKVSPRRKAYSTSAKIPTPKVSTSSSKSSSGFDVTKFTMQAAKTSLSALQTLFTIIIQTPGTTWFYLTRPAERTKKIAEIREMAKKEFDHYWMGTKLLMADIRTARSLLAKTLAGSTLTRRERKQLLRTVSDLFRIVPFSMFILIPFMEFALPFALRLFPNMLPSTFQDSLKAEETMKRELQSRIAMTQFFQETLEELAKEQKRIAQKRKEKALPNKESGNDEECDETATLASKQEDSAASMLNFLERARNGEALSSDVIVQYATYFQDDLTLGNMPRMQLVNMCKYMSIPPYGSDTFLQFQLRHKIRTLKEDDQRILWEGIDSLTKMELREACQERGMRSTGLSKDAYRKALQQWLDLSVNKNVPISLLIMSRIFYLQEEMIASTADDENKTVASLADAISGLDKDVLNEVVLEVATSEEQKSDPDVRKIKLEVLAQQNEKIRQEQADRDAAAKKKENAEKADSSEAATASESMASIAADPATKITIDVTMEKVEPAEIVSDGKKAESEGDDDHDLSSEEMDAISQLLTPDPVSREKAEIQKIKSAIQDAAKDDDAPKEAQSSQAVDDEAAAGETTGSAIDESGEGDATKQQDSSSPTTGTADDKFDDAAIAAAQIAKAESDAKQDADEATQFTPDSHLAGEAKGEVETSAIADDGTTATEESLQAEGEEEAEAEEEEEEVTDPVVERLKKRIASMVDKLEVQLSDVQVKIGDKLHFLDKDMDGILSREEMAQCLQQVLKREITMEEAMEIAAEMDDNKDGYFTVQELIQWIETNKLVQFVKEGRDAEMDRIMDSNHSDDRDDDDKESDAVAGKDNKEGQDVKAK